MFSSVPRSEVIAVLNSVIGAPDAVVQQCSTFYMHYSICVQIKSHIRT